MREGWEVLSIADVLTYDVRRVPVEPGRDYPIVGVLGFGRGLLFREPVSTGTTSYRELNAIGPDQVVYSKLKAFEGAITVTPPDLSESYASGEFPTFTVTRRAIPAFIRLLTQRSELWAAMAANSKGMGGRRERLSPRDFATVRATFPPVSEQRRIVDLIGALDDAIDGAESDLRAAMIVRDRFLDSQFGGSPRVPAKSLLAGIEGGRSPKSIDTPPGPDDEGVLKVSAVTSLGFDPRESKTITDGSIFAELHRLRANDVLITRANTAALVGQVCLVPEDHTQLFLCDKTLRLKPATGVSPLALVAALNSPTARVQLSAAATGSSASMKNISQENIREISTGWPDDPDSVGLADQALLARCRCAQESIQRLRELRAVLLTSIHRLTFRVCLCLWIVYSCGGVTVWGQGCWPGLSGSSTGVPWW